MWREACQKHLHTLSFNSHDWPLYRDLSTSRLEILITQKTRLQGLSILMDDVDGFSASIVVAWLMYTRESLQWLFYNVRTAPDINVGERSWKSLRICTKKTLHLSFLSSSEKGTLKYFKIDDVCIIHLDVGDAVDNLETVDVSNFTINWTKLHQMISKSSTMRSLRLWDEEDEIVDVETIALCFPQLNHLAVSYDLRDELREGIIHYGLLSGLPVYCKDALISLN
ncbi:F-box/LRR-repeat protein [Capsicum chinense]|nr:F-box/LRR-repeat protein [Capsicum chinense]